MLFRSRALRGIADLATYDASARHENRPHEIFAEDFRVLFGGALAVGSGSIENAALVSPQSVSGLREFLAGLASTPTGRLVVSSNPARGPIQFRQTHGAIVPLDVFDVRGRRVMTLEPRVAGADVEWRADAHGMAGPQVLFARPRAPGAPGARFIWAP